MNYTEYINSKEWKDKAKKFKELNSTCYVCGLNKGLSVHHITYVRLGNEHPWDMVSLCREHHKRVHFSNKGNFFSDFKRIYNRVKSLRKHFIKMEKFKRLK